MSLAGQHSPHRHISRRASTQINEDVENLGASQKGGLRCFRPARKILRSSDVALCVLFSLTLPLIRLLSCSGNKEALCKYRSLQVPAEDSGLVATESADMYARALRLVAAHPAESLRWIPRATLIIVPAVFFRPLRESGLASRRIKICHRAPQIAGYPWFPCFQTSAYLKLQLDARLTCVCLCFLSHFTSLQLPLSRVCSCQVRRFRHFLLPLFSRAARIGFENISPMKYDP
jgi:hypothetical protein